VVYDLYKEQEEIADFIHCKHGFSRPNIFVNATGLASYYVVGDKDVYARRGAVYRFPHKNNDDISHIQHLDLLKEHAFCVPVSELNPQDKKKSTPQNDPDSASLFAFVIPRGDHSIIVGGFSESLKGEELEKTFKYYKENHKMDDQYTCKHSEEYREMVKEMTENARHFLAPVADLLDHYKHNLGDYLYTGLRPFRKNGARVELQEKTNIIHNYGHGGSGISWSVGCAVETAYYARKYWRGKGEYTPSIGTELRAFLQTHKKEYLFVSLGRDEDNTPANIVADVFI